MGYRTIMVCTDGSETAGVALRTAVRIAKRTRAELVVLCAFEPPGMTVERAGRVIEEAKALAESEGVEATTVKQLGPAGEVIMDVAVRLPADVIVMGNRGMGKARRFELGGVPDFVAHHAPCDVLIVDTAREPGPDTDDEDEDAPPVLANRIYRSLLVGTDGSPTATEAARKAFELALMLRAPVVGVVFVGDPIVGAIVADETGRSAMGKTEVRTHVVQGDPAEKILEVARTEEHDLIVVGNKGMAGARRYLLGSVPNKVAHGAGTDVLIAKTVGRSVEDLAPGHGGVVEYQGRIMAVYKDEQNGLHVVSPRCTHMGCTVDWNDAEKTWDCPCHGSRYDLDGRVIEGPAVKGLA